MARLQSAQRPQRHRGGNEQPGGVALRQVFVARSHKWTIPPPLYKNAIERMLRENRDCSEILMQLVSARKAIKSLSETLIHSHMRHCIEHAHSPAEGRKELQELLVVLERYVE
ncbi:MAG: metal-sensitive transcriptional regulator [Verrucomicrobia bacterium]|nr:metal-sensitive transcriptional regulator [Verrucomicrobiota bacterium]MBI3867317.1 metal-sensitive transcriptional regulator [Verrucomicrobiota bacterium]